MHLSLYRNDLDGGPPTLLYEDPDCRPFILQCNVSDIFPGCHRPSELGG